MDAVVVDQLDLNSSNFDCEAYLSDLLRKKSLDELVQVEEDMVHNVRRLDSEMQQLVYENYNKFLTATSTVKKMQSDFVQMGREMEDLTARMSKIASLSKDISSAFGKHRANVSQLAEANRKVKRLQFLLSLPQKLQTLAEAHRFDEAVKMFITARPSLLRFKDVQAIHSIYEETVVIMDSVKDQLHKVITVGLVSSEDLPEAITLLLKLGTTSSAVYADFLMSCKRNLSSQLSLLETKKKVSNADVVEVVDSLIKRFQELIKERFLEETDARECAVVVRALDRFYRRLSSCNQLLPGVDYLPICVSMLDSVSRHEIELARKRVTDRVGFSLQQACDELSTSLAGSVVLSEVITRLEHSLLVQLKTALASLLLFTASDMTFSSLEPSQFALGFGVDVHERLVVRSLEEIAAFGRRQCRYDKLLYTSSPILPIVLAQFFMNVESHSVSYVFDLCEEQFRLVAERERVDSRLTTAEKAREGLRTVAYDLLRTYAYLQGLQISQVLIRSVETRDWLKCAEPSSVRPAIKHFIDELISVDNTIKPFMGEGTRKERLLEGSSTRAHTRRNTNLDTCSISSTLDKLWSERVDFWANIEAAIAKLKDTFENSKIRSQAMHQLEACQQQTNEPVKVFAERLRQVTKAATFTRSSILTTLVNIALKSFLECLRFQTFSKYGLQQIQVDCCFLQQNLWRYLSDEQVAFSLLDEIVSSTVHRSVDPKLMEPTTVKAICGRL